MEPNKKRDSSTATTMEADAYMGGICSFLSNREAFGLEAVFSLRRACREFKRACDVCLSQVYPRFRLDADLGKNLLEDVKRKSRAAAFLRYVDEPGVYSGAVARLPSRDVMWGVDFGANAGFESAAVIAAITGGNTAKFKQWYLVGAVTCRNESVLRGCAVLGGKLAHTISEWLMVDMKVPLGPRSSPRMQRMWLRAAKFASDREVYSDILDGVLYYETVRDSREFFSDQWAKSCSRYMPGLFSFRPLSAVFEYDDANLLASIVETGGWKAGLMNCTTVMDVVVTADMGPRCMEYLIKNCDGRYLYDLRIAAIKLKDLGLAKMAEDAIRDRIDN